MPTTTARARSVRPLPPLLSLRRTLALAFSAVLLVAAALLSLGTAPPAAALGNGLAPTPQMGFNDWNAYGCNVSESLIKSTAQAMHTNGMQAAGYSYVNIDDCWMTHNRDSGGHLVPDPAKFPDGIKGTADYVHSLGLKLGIYEDAGTATCAGYPGSLGHESTDAQSFASWGVDYLKYDNCNNSGVPARTRYTAMRDALAATGRPILYSLCNWGQDNVWTWGADVGNSWRTTGDISPSFSSMLSIFHSNVGLASYAGPGHWNDPDMLEVGNGSMTATESRSEFSLWAEMAAPLIAGTDIPSASSSTLSVLTNSRVIAVDQDSSASRAPWCPPRAAWTCWPSRSPTGTCRWPCSTRRTPRRPSPPPRPRSARQGRPPTPSPTCGRAGPRPPPARSAPPCRPTAP